MLIKIDVRETDLIPLLQKRVDSSSTAPPSGSQTQKYTIELSEGVSIQLPVSAVGSAGSVKNHTISVERLAVGDIILCDSAGQDVVMFERKTLYDLAASIKDGRYAEQSFRLDSLPMPNHNIIYVVEGDLAAYNEYRGRTPKKVLQSAMISILGFKGFSVYRTMSLAETADFIYQFAEKYDKETSGAGGKKLYYQAASASASAAAGEHGTTTEDAAAPHYCEVLRIKKEKSENITPENIGELMLCSIPGISAKTAIAIMAHFKTLHRLIVALASGGKSVMNDIYTETESGVKRKIGKATIDKLVRYLHVHADAEADTDGQSK